MRWWGWGDPAQPPALGTRALAYLREHVGIGHRPRPPVALSRVGLPPSRLGEGQLDRLRAIVGSDGVSDEHPIRVLHAAGKGYPDLIRMRAGTPDGAPDAVVFPRSHEQVAELLRACASASLAVVPFGGGTSVVGGVARLARGARRGGEPRHPPDGRRARLDTRSRTVTVQGGLRAPALEGQLAGQGFTLGHYPQSFEYVSLGGCAATRSAGQASTGYGAIDKMVVGLRLAAPSDEIRLAPVPATAAGPGLRQLVVGSEGTLGVLTEVSLRVRPAPSAGVYEGMFFSELRRGRGGPATARGGAPVVARRGAAVRRTGDRAVAAVGRTGGTRRAPSPAPTWAPAGWPGGAWRSSASKARSTRWPRGARAPRSAARLRRQARVGSSPGHAWLRGRFAGPYLRDDLLGHGVMAETLETAAQWSQLLEVYDAVATAISTALSAQGTPGLVMCHVSHVYETGASLYYTFSPASGRARRSRSGRPSSRRPATRSATAAPRSPTTTRSAATTRRWLPGEVSPGGVAVLRAAKEELDPTGIMNPGKLLDGREPIRG